jgi:formate dehydrogenase major subunit
MATVTLTIDNRQITAQAGTTVLAAARNLGIEIPTLCHVPGLAPVASCFLCAVQVAGRRNLSPACALPVADGMVVTTASEDVRAARRMALELLLSDHAGECVAPCAARCPAGLDIPGFVHALTEDGPWASMAIITRRLALPGALGRVCPRLCEQHCRRCEQDQGLAIGALHRYVADRDGAEADRYQPACLPATGKTVAIVGAGPAGLAAAFYLLQQGHACTLLDAHAQPGGMLRYGIPDYRLPKDALAGEIASIAELGATFWMNTRLGTDCTLADLRRDFDAVFLAIGAQRAQGLRCPGEDITLPGIAFLKQVAEDRAPALGDDVIVVGGGNTAMDCARSAVRLGARRVTVLYRRTRREMPCLMEEVEGAEQEGVRMEYLTAPIALRSDDHGRLSLTCRRMELGEADASGRRRPVPIAGSEFALACTTVIAAIGQSVDTAVAERAGVAVHDWGIATDDRTLATNLPGVFAGGDAVLGADLAVRAVAAGRGAAASIDQYLRGTEVTGEPSMINVRMQPIDDDERAAIFRAIESAPRVPMPQIDMSRRLTSFDEVELGLPKLAADHEARRCMTCGCRKAEGCRVRLLATEYEVDVQRFAGARRRFAQDFSHPEIVYEPGKCIMCDACVRIAAEADEALGLATVGRGFDVAIAVPFDQPLSEGLRKVARECAESCPTAALALRGSGCASSGCASCALAP